MIARMVAVMVCIVVLSACGRQTPPPPPPEDLRVAWTQDGDLYVWSSSDGITSDGITSAGGGTAPGAVSRVILSPDAGRVAFTRAGAHPGESLWVAGIDGTGVRAFDVPPYLRQVAWIDSETLLLNTFTLDASGDIPRGDLYMADSVSGMVTQLDPGGHFSVSPDGTAFVVIDPGAYGERPGRILARHPNGTWVALMDFPAVSTGAHYAFYPEIHWHDETTLYLALPDPDAVYHDLDAAMIPPVALWRLTLDGAHEQVGSVNTSYFGLPQWSFDTAAMAYLTRQQDPNLFTLWTANHDGTGAAIYLSQTVPGDVPVPVWLKDRRAFLYLHENAYWVGTPGEPPQKWLDGGEMLLTLTLKMVDSAVVFLAVRPDGSDLRYALLDDSGGHSTRIASGAALGDFDVAKIR